jgi:methionyl-tRNA formyltransferase
VRLAVAATPSVAIPTLESLISSNHEIAFVVTQVDKPAGRGKELKQSIVAQWAMDRDIAVYKPLEIRDIAEPLKSADLLLTIAFGTILPLEILSAPKRGSINMHFSLLPQWRGAAPVQRAIEHGDSIGGITIFALDQGMDTGPIFLKTPYSIPPESSSGEVLEELSKMGANLVLQTIELISSGVLPTPQDSVGASHARKVTKSDALIRWNEDAEKVLRSIRAFTPDPGAWTIWRSEPLRISKGRLAHADHPLRPGEISFRGKELIVGCGFDTAICLEEVTPAGKKSMNAIAWSNGARISAGECFGE